MSREKQRRDCRWSRSVEEAVPERGPEEVLDVEHELLGGQAELCTRREVEEGSVLQGRGVESREERQIAIG